MRALKPEKIKWRKGIPPKSLWGKDLLVRLCVPPDNRVKHLITRYEIGNIAIPHGWQLMNFMALNITGWSYIG